MNPQHFGVATKGKHVIYCTVQRLKRQMLKKVRKKCKRLLLTRSDDKYYLFHMSGTRPKHHFYELKSS